MSKEETKEEKIEEKLKDKAQFFAIMIGFTFQRGHPQHSTTQFTACIQTTGLVKALSRSNKMDAHFLASIHPPIMGSGVSATGSLPTMSVCLQSFPATNISTPLLPTHSTIEFLNSTFLMRTSGSASTPSNHKGTGTTQGLPTILQRTQSGCFTTKIAEFNRTPSVQPVISNEATTILRSKPLLRLSGNAV